MKTLNLSSNKSRRTLKQFIFFISYQTQKQLDKKTELVHLKCVNAFNVPSSLAPWLDPRIRLDPLHTLTTAFIEISNDNKAKFHTERSQVLSGPRVAPQLPRVPVRSLMFFLCLYILVFFPFFLHVVRVVFPLQGRSEAKTSQHSRSVGFLTGRGPPLAISRHGAPQALDGF